MMYDQTADSMTLDNMGFQPYLVHENVIKQVTDQHPRMKWSGCFSSTIKAEIGVCIGRRASEVTH